MFNKVADLSETSMGTQPKFKWFHVLGNSRCPYCMMLQGAIKMHLHTSSEAQYDRRVCYHDSDTQEGMRSWHEEAASVQPRGYNTVPRVVAEFSDGSLAWIGGLDDFVRKLGCPKKH